MTDKKDKAPDLNMRIWDQMDKTPPSHTKPGNPDGYNITSISTGYAQQKPTEVFGPCGIGWGFEIVSSEFHSGAPIYKPGSDEILGHEILHSILITLWYMLDGKRGEIPAYGHTKFVYKTSSGPRSDSEVEKKSLTDAIKKALSFLGFAADIYGGLFDDTEYLKEAKIKEQLENEEKAGEVLEGLRDEYKTWLDKETKAYAMIPNAPAVQAVHKKHLIYARKQAALMRVPEERALKPLIDAFNARITELKQPEKEQHL